MRWKNLGVISESVFQHVDLSCILRMNRKDSQEECSIPFLHRRATNCFGADLVLHGFLFSTHKIN